MLVATSSGSDRAKHQTATVSQRSRFGVSVRICVIATTDAPARDAAINAKDFWGTAGSWGTAPRLEQGDNFVDIPNVIGNARFHRRSDAQRLMNPTKVGSGTV